jgi:LysR family transcriptional activator of glutamate synthase operon
MFTLKQLRYFKEVAEEGHLSNAARRLYISQTALSSMIIGLEERLETKLFDREGRNIRLNESGRVFLRYVDEVFTALENAKIELRDLNSKEQSAVYFTMSSSHLWAGMLQRFSSRYPHYEIRQENCNVDRFREKLFKLELDFVITGLSSIDLEGLEHTVIRNEALYLCIPPNHKFAHLKDISLVEARDESFISLPVSAPFRHCCDTMFKQAGFKCNSVLECDYTLRSNLIEAGHGIGITTQTARETMLLGVKNKYIRINDSFARHTLSIIWNPKRHLSRAALDFRSFLINYCKALNAKAN